ncbi:MAG TPA: hypothetical protein VK200_15900 [Candidatus Limnocylindrales bacterium]|nr:hypothetical protein [Candidatus Limnocylindrales bacterium]
MCRFLSLDFEYELKCPVDKASHKVQFQPFPQLRGQALDVVGCDAKRRLELLSCGKICRGLLESGTYWQRIYPESAVYTQSQ